jgi:SAM-dependent methyltransferase
MNLKKSSAILGRDHYRRLYQTQLEEEAEWLWRGAAEKVNSIEILLHRNKIKPKIILELGCGVGAVITGCQRRNIAKKYIGVDYAPEAIEYLRKHSAGIEAIQSDIIGESYLNIDGCDVIILSHVLEHLEEPGKLLNAMKKLCKFSYAVLEVPLEDLAASRIKAVLRDRTANQAGHVQFFTDRSFEYLLRLNGYKIVDRRTYVPILDMETIRVVSKKDGLAWHRRLLKVLTSNCLPKICNPLWKRLYYAHHAVLCIAKH